ncbi:MAG: Sec-independent protein translocase subunit TatA [Pseudonocardiaceae bacterium]
MGIPSGWELILLLGVLVLLFGATKLPTAARSIGQSMRIFKAETKGLRSEDEAPPPAPQQAPPPPATQQQSLPPSAPAANPVQEPQRHTDTTR